MNGREIIDGIAGLFQVAKGMGQQILGEGDDDEGAMLKAAIHVALEIGVRLPEYAQVVVADVENDGIFSRALPTMLPALVARLPFTEESEDDTTEEGGAEG